MTQRLLTLCMAALLLCSLHACRSLEKRPFHEGIDLPDRMHNQQIMIGKAVSSGDLTPQEAEIVRDNLNGIRQEYAKAQSDGRISGEEWNKVEQYLDSNSRMISDVKNYPAQRLFSGSSRPAAAMTIQEKINSQQQRIDEGISTGELTLKEADVVQGNLNWIKAHYSHLRSDGTFTPQEENEIVEYLVRNADMIIHKKDQPVRRIY